MIIRKILERTDMENYSIKNFMIWVSKQIKSGETILDAGAGERQYKKYFTHTKYESTDFSDTFYPGSTNKHTFLCDLEKIPRKNNYYDTILCTQVLEHVPNPEKVLKEFHRILKSGGKLFLTAPQSWGIHGKEPYHYFNFTKYGLEVLFKKTEFRIHFIKPRGGFPWYLGKLLTIGHSMIKAYIKNKIKTLIKKPYNLLVLIQIILLIPIFIISLLLFRLIIPIILSYIDFFDTKKNWTLGYKCYCTK